MQINQNEMKKMREKWRSKQEAYKSQQMIFLPRTETRGNIEYHPL